MKKKHLIWAMIGVGAVALMAMYVATYADIHWYLMNHNKWICETSGGTWTPEYKPTCQLHDLLPK